MLNVEARGHGKRTLFAHFLGVIEVYEVVFGKLHDGEEPTASLTCWQMSLLRKTQKKNIL